jgi:hypothetical protein
MDVRFQRELVSNQKRAGRDTKQALDTLVALDEIEAAAAEYRDRIDAMAVSDVGP